MTNEFVLLADIHGNYPALKAVVDEEGYDAEYMVRTSVSPVFTSVLLFGLALLCVVMLALMIVG